VGEESGKEEAVHRANDEVTDSWVRQIIAAGEDVQWQQRRIAMHNPVMIGERVYLRPCEVSDAEAFARWFAEEDETFMYRGREPLSPITLSQGIAYWYRMQPLNFVGFVVCLIADDTMIGNVSTLSVDWVNRTGETASLFAPGYRGQGYGPEAKHLLLEYSFDVLQLHVLMSVVATTNTRSAAALGKQGYRPAGRMRRYDVKGGVYRDVEVFDVLRPDWLAARDQWRAARSLARRQ